MERSDDGLGDDCSLDQDEEYTNNESIDGLTLDSSFIGIGEGEEIKDESEIPLATGVNRSVVSPSFKSVSSTKKVIDEVKAPMHLKLIEALQDKSSYISPLHVDVKNESYWFQQRKK